ncbi:MAG: sulfatase [Haloarculaceae archaeon]
MPPNVVVLHSHDTGRHVAPYGHAVPTPNLDEFADESLQFRRAHSPAPTCSPSRAALTTGLAPHAVGMTGLVNRGWTMDCPERHLATLLREAGYDTALAGFQHEHGGPDADRELGYRTFPTADGSDEDGDGGASDDRATAAAAAEYVSDADGPFFLSAAFFDTHRPFPDADEHDVDPDDVRPFGPLPDVPATRADVAGFHASAAALDARIGRVLDALEAADLLDETLVVYTTDHGPAFPGMKCTLSDAGTGVALLARFPDGPRGETTDGLVSHTDLVPTLAEYLGLDVPEAWHGESWLDAVGDPASFEGRDAVYEEVTYHAAYEPMRSVRTGRYRYVRRFDDYPTTVLPNIDDGPAKRFLRDHGLGERERPREALYDLYHDPGEQDNLVDDPALADVRDDLRGRLEERMRETADPLLAGPVSKPPGGEANPQDGRDPGDPEREPGNAR